MFSEPRLKLLKTMQSHIFLEKNIFKKIQYTERLLLIGSWIFSSLFFRSRFRFKDYEQDGASAPQRRADG